jgi:hypothetical protein
MKAVANRKVYGSGAIVKDGTYGPYYKVRLTRV